MSLTATCARPANLARRTLSGVTLVAALLAGGCLDAQLEDGEPLWTEGQNGGERIIVDPAWELLWILGGADDDILAQPSAVSVRDGGVAVADLYDGRVIGISAAGEPQWSFGRKGEGPGEFSRIQDMQLGDGGVLHVLDNENARITRLSSDGEFLSELPVPGDTWSSMVPVQGGYILEGGSAEAPMAFFPDGGSSDPEARRFPVPWDGFGDLHILQRQGEVLAGTDGRWVFSFTFGNGFFPFRGSEPVGYLGQHVQHMEFPVIVTETTQDRRTTGFISRPPCATCSGWMKGDTVNILVQGEGDDRLRLVDRYDFETGKYLSTLRLPQGTNRITQAGDLYLLLVSSPWPALKAFRIMEGAGP